MNEIYQLVIYLMKLGLRKGRGISIRDINKYDCCF